MNRSTFEAADPIVDQMAEKIDRALDSAQFSEIRQALVRLSAAVGPQFSVNLNMCARVFDRERSHPLPLLQSGIVRSFPSQPTLAI
jgi:hypothetical protein